MKTRRRVFSVAAVALLASGRTVQALFTGSDQFDRADLNSEKRVDLEYALDLAAFRPFWEPPPAAEAPRATLRTTEGSLTTDELYIRREAGFRFHVSSASYLGFDLRRLENVEQKMSDQIFLARVGLAKGFGLRLSGQPTGRKQSSDIGLGADWRGERGVLAVDWRFVDLNFTSKNLEGDEDRKKPHNLNSRAGWRWDRLAVEVRWDLDTPVEREFPGEDQLFRHRAWRMEALLAAENWRGSAFWESHRRSTDRLSDAARTQDFHKDAGGLCAEKEFALGRHLGRPGVRIERRWSEYGSLDPAQGSARRRWQAVPSLELDARLTRVLSIPFGLYGGAAWDSGHPSWEGKFRTPLRMDFTPDIVWVLNVTWDIDELGSSRSFDGGNVMFEGRLP